MASPASPEANPRPLRPRARALAALVCALALLMAAAVGGLKWVAAQVYADLTPPLRGFPLEPLPGLPSISAGTCSQCHQTIHDEWGRSNHGRAVSDPLYQADLEHQGTPFHCDRCHAPLVEQQAQIVSGLRWAWPVFAPASEPNPHYDEALHGEGVTCVVCHQSQGAMVGPHTTSRSPHAVRTSDELASVELCRPCHSMNLRFVGTFQRPLMETLTEWEEYRRKGGEKVCVDCHMPRVPPRPLTPGGPERPARSHALRGPFDLAFVRTALGLDVSLTSDREGVTASGELENRTGHRLPTADPQRRLELILEVVDSGGRVLQSARQVLQRVVDLKELSEESGDDTTLHPRETRAFRLSLPGPFGTKARTARFIVRFVIWEPTDPIAIASGLGPAELVHDLYERYLELVH